MRLVSLTLYQYRNFNGQEIHFCPGTNLLFGKNGQGKTNLLEAIYLLAYGRSFRTPAAKECIQHGASEAKVEGSVEHRSLVRDLGIFLPRTDEKQLLMFGKPAGLSEFIGNFHALAFTQEHLKVVRGGPMERRAFVDRALVMLKPGYMQRIASYNRALKQRNRILGAALGSGARPDHGLLEAWEEKLAQEGSCVLWNRIQYVDRMKNELTNPMSSRESLEIRYESTASKNQNDTGGIEQEFREMLRAARNVDEKRGFTTIGPHRDDLKIILDGKPLADFGSAGQQRSSLLALYFAQMEIHLKSRGFYPAFLMDDVEAELDNERLLAFLEHLSRRTQTFLTTAKEQVLPALPEGACRFHVQQGMVSPA